MESASINAIKDKVINEIKEEECENIAKIVRKIIVYEDILANPTESFSKNPSSLEMVRTGLRFQYQDFKRWQKLINNLMLEEVQKHLNETILKLEKHKASTKWHGREWCMELGGIESSIKYWKRILQLKTKYDILKDFGDENLERFFMDCHKNVKVETDFIPLPALSKTSSQSDSDDIHYYGVEIVSGD